MMDTDAPSMIVVMGVTGSGKSHFINQMAGREVVQEGASLHSCKYLKKKKKSQRA